MAAAHITITAGSLKGVALRDSPGVQATGADSQSRSRGALRESLVEPQTLVRCGVGKRRGAQLRWRRAFPPDAITRDVQQD